MLMVAVPLVLLLGFAAAAAATAADAEGEGGERRWRATKKQRTNVRLKRTGDSTGRSNR